MKRFSVLLVFVFSIILGASTAGAEGQAVNTDPFIEVSSSESITLENGNVLTSSKRYSRLINYNPGTWLTKAYSVGISSADIKQNYIHVQVRTHESSGREINSDRSTKYGNTYVEATAKAVTKPTNQYSKTFHEFRRAGINDTKTYLTNTRWP